MSLLKDIQSRRALAEDKTLVKNLGIKGAKSVSAPGESLFNKKKGSHAELQQQLGNNDADKANKARIKKLGKPVKEEAEQIDEGLRKVATYHSENGKHTATVHKDTEWGEHRVKFHTDGKHHAKADYHTDDHEDAHSTARAHLKHMENTHKESVEFTDEQLEELSETLTIEEYEQLDEVSKDTLKSYIAKADADKRPAKADPSDPKQFKNALHNLKRSAGVRQAEAKLKEETGRSLKDIISEARGRPKKPRTLDGEIAPDAK
jgi:hypothetical protein